MTLDLGINLSPQLRPHLIVHGERRIQRFNEQNHVRLLIDTGPPIWRVAGTIAPSLDGPVNHQIVLVIPTSIRDPFRA